MITLGPPASECRVLTYREGLLSALGHDLELAVTRFEIRVDVDARTVDATFDATSLRVVRALRDGVETGVSDRDRTTIEQNCRRDVLDADRHPEIRYRSSRVVEVDGGFDVEGNLALRGTQRPVAVRLRRAGDRYLAEVPIHQPDFGIEPFSALLGAIKVKPRVVVRLALTAEPSRPTTSAPRRTSGT